MLNLLSQGEAQPQTPPENVLCSPWLTPYYSVFGTVIPHQLFTMTLSTCQNLSRGFPPCSPHCKELFST